MINEIIVKAILPLAVRAQMLQGDVKTNSDQITEGFRSKAGFGDMKLGNAVELVISGFLSLLGIIFIILVVYAGYSWMTASGDEQKVTKAKDTIYRAIIGLLITLAAYAITYFVFKYVPFGGGGGPQGWD